MTQVSLENTRITAQSPVPSPAELHTAVPVTSEARQSVEHGRAAIESVLERRDPRFFVVVGPCSIHDVSAAVDYADRLRRLADEVSDRLLLVMRVYFEKPRTTVGWKGLINDPDLNDSFDIPRGLRVARQLMARINEMGLPVGTEALDPLTPQYLGDLVSWSAIGARTTESQTHREMASGLSTPVGFKNGTDGSLSVAINAMQSAAAPHAFLGVDFQGRPAVMRTRGNPHGHLILRGGVTPNYDSVSVADAVEQLRGANLPENIVVDCSHGNSLKKPDRQPLVLRDVAAQVRRGNSALVGAMLESHLIAGAQKLTPDLSALVYGQSVTDGCLGWDATRETLLDLAGAL